MDDLIAAYSIALLLCLAATGIFGYGVWIGRTIERANWEQAAREVRYYDEARAEIGEPEFETAPPYEVPVATVVEEDPCPICDPHLGCTEYCPCLRCHPES